MKKRLTALLLALIMLASVTSCTKKDADTVTDEVDISPVIWSDTTTVTASMYTYFFNAYYKSFVNKYGDFLDSMGLEKLDTTKALGEQKFSEERTWYEYIMTLCFNEIKETMALADAAKAAGEDLSDDDIEIVTTTLDEYDKAAEKAEMTTDEYIASIFGEKVNRVTIEKCLRLQRLAAVHYMTIADSDPMTEADCQKYFAENAKDFLYYDCLRIVVPEEDSAALTACIDDTEFIEAMRAIITKNNFNGDYEKYKTSIDKLVANKRYKRIGYNEDSAVAEWAFATDRKPYDIFTQPAPERDGDIDVYMILPVTEAGKYSDVLYRDAEPVRNICYIRRDSEEDAKRIYDDWKNSGDASEESFKALTEKYNGGTATNINRSNYDAALNEWIFSKAVKAGDSTVLTIEGAGTYVFYMLESGDASWLVDVRDSITDGNLDDAIDELLEKFPTEYSGIIYNTEEVKFS